VAFVERDQPVETLPTDRPDQALAERVGLRRSHGRLQNSQPHRRHGTVDRGGIDRIAIVDEKAMRSLARDRGAELLDSPLGGRMGSDVPVRDPARTDLQHETYKIRKRPVTEMKQSQVWFANTLAAAGINTEARASLNE
jgi:hypothetical protein